MPDPGGHYSKDQTLGAVAHVEVAPAREREPWEDQMAGKLSFLVGLGAGYVLGARSGRERYEQIAAKAQGLWHDPRVQEKAEQAQQLARQKAGQAQQVVKDKVSGPTGTGETGIGWPDDRPDGISS